MGPAWLARSPDVDQKVGVRSSHLAVVVEHRYHAEDVLKERQPGGASSPACEENANAKLGDCDGGDRDVVVVVDQLIERVP